MERYTISKLVQSVIDGQESPLLAYAILKEESDYVKSCIEEIKGAVDIEKDKYQEKKFTHAGYSFEKRSGGFSFSYDHIEEYARAKGKVKDLEQKYKRAYANYKENILSVDDNGEEVVLPIAKARADSLMVKKTR